MMRTFTVDYQGVKVDGVGIHGVASVFVDGGVIRKNPSPYGGTVGMCWVDGQDQRIAHASGLIRADPGLTVTNNHTELAAAIVGLEHVPDGWAGTLYTDSNVTRIRLVSMQQTGRAKLKGIPLDLRERLEAVVKRLGAFRVVLVGGHPTKADLARGRRKDGLPVSAHNVLCDNLCRAEAQKYLRDRFHETADSTSTKS